MDSKNNLILWKLVAVSAAIFYVYKVSKANGGTLNGNPMGVTINRESLLNLASHLAPIEHRSTIRSFGHKLLESYDNQTQRGYNYEDV